MIAQNLASIRSRIAAACRRSGRTPDDVTLVAVSKTQPASLIKEGIAAGIGAFGENKVQEAEEKIGVVGPDAADWHLIGHLQSNKARKAVQLFDVIHSLDSVELATRLERICDEEGRDTLRVLVQVDMAGESTKNGINTTALPQLVADLRKCRHLRFEGLMTLPPYFDDPEATRPYFQQLRTIRDRLAADRAFSDGAGHLSMGMSHDFEVAIEEGATIVRVGTAIFGERERVK